MNNMVIISSLPHDMDKGGIGRLFDKTVSIFIIACLAILLFCIAISIILVRSIASSIMVLEKATQRVASGELDLPIEIKGSNEITSLTGSLNRLRLALKEERARRSRFIMGISHDLKTPLALIVGYVEAISDGFAISADERAQYMEIIRAKESQLEGMINDLIDFSRVDTGEWRLSLKPVKLEPFIRTFVKRVEADASLLKRNLASDIMIPPDTVVSMDERMALRAIENIVNNALRYMPEGGTALIRVFIKKGTQGREECVLEVEDNGPGIDAKELQNVFEPFYRGTNSRREQGSGLGLAIVKSIVDSHGWEITARSTVGAGTVFSITIPMAKA
jgi:signal transduction histidine kinase